MREKVGLNTK